MKKLWLIVLVGLLIVGCQDETVKEVEEDLLIGFFVTTDSLAEGQENEKIYGQENLGSYTFGDLEGRAFVYYSLPTEEEYTNSYWEGDKVYDSYIALHDDHVELSATIYLTKDVQTFYINMLYMDDQDQIYMVQSPLTDRDTAVALSRFHKDQLRVYQGGGVAYLPVEWTINIEFYSHTDAYIFKQYDIDNQLLSTREFTEDKPLKVIERIDQAAYGVLFSYSQGEEVYRENSESGPFRMYKDRGHGLIDVESLIYTD